MKSVERVRNLKIEMANILIVEDEPRMRRLLEISLGEDGHMVQSAEDAEKGLAHLRALCVAKIIAAKSAIPEQLG